MANIYWSLQTLKAWEQFQKQGYIVGSSDYAGYPEQYRWMMQQMSERLTNYNGEFPIWLSLKKSDPTGFFPPKTEFVRFQLELDERDVLVSDSLDWNAVLNNNYLYDNDEEWDEFIFAEDNGLNKEELKKGSWVKIFQLDRNRDIEWEESNERILQGVTGKINLNRILSVECFTSI